VEGIEKPTMDRLRKKIAMEGRVRRGVRILSLIEKI
jgi:hypothetical protein